MGGSSYQKPMSIFPSITAIGTKAFSPASTADGAGESTDVTATGAALGDFVIVSFNQDTVDFIVTAMVTAANTITVRFQNETGTGSTQITSGTLRVICFDLNSGK